MIKCLSKLFLKMHYYRSELRTVTVYWLDYYTLDENCRVVYKMRWGFFLSFINLK